METLELLTDDQVRLGARWFRAKAPVATVVIAPAIGVVQRYYEAFAEFLASRGLETLTFDYRGLGASKAGPVRKMQATLRQWGEFDLATALKTGLSEGRPTLLLGHSAGGQLAGLAAPSSQLAGFLAVACPSAYWGHWSGWGKARMVIGNYAVIPAVTAVLGYLPLKYVMGAGEDLPAGVAYEWARWSRHAEYVLGYAGERRAGYEALRCPMRSYGFSDDPIAPPRAVEALTRAYPNAQLELKVLTRAELGKPIGHFGYFRPAWRDTLWEEAASWLRSTATPLQPAA